jgi:transposase
MISIGVDLHVRNSFMTSIDSETGEIKEKVRVSNTKESLSAYFSQFEGKEVKVLVEATTNTYPFVMFLRGFSGLDICVVNPRKMRVIADSVCKTDSIDSEVLAEFGLSNLRLPESYIPSAEVHDLRSELRSRAALVAMRTQIKNHVHGLLHGEGFFHGPDDIFTKSGRAWLSELSLCQGARRRLDCYLRVIEVFDYEIERVDRLLRDHYSRQPFWEEDVRILRSMPGIGLITSLTILSEIGDRSRFRGADSVVNFAGLVPRLDSSNQKFHYGHITKHGPRLLRWVLSEAAHVAVKKVPRYRAAYEVISKKSGKKKANIAIARKMLKHAFLMLERRRLFEYESRRDSQQNYSRSTGESSHFVWS